MKKFLKDLEKELKKLHMNSKDITEIINDHKEMLEQALYDGLTDEEIINKFGDPKKLASELTGDSKENEEILTLENEFVLYKSFSAHGFKNVRIAVVSEDTKYVTHSKDTIEVHFKNIEKPEKYQISYDNGLFVFGRENTRSLFSRNFKSDLSQIIFMVPKNIILHEFYFKTVSGDAEIRDVEAKSINIKTTSGDAKIENIKADNGNVNTVSGDYEFSNFKFSNLKLSSVSGDYDINSGIIEKDFSMNTVSGDFNIKEVFSGETSLKTVSGDIEGKEFYPEKVDLKSVSGDIIIENEDKTKEIKIGRKKSVSGEISIK